MTWALSLTTLSHMDMVVVVVPAPRSTLHFTGIAGWVRLAMKTKKRGRLFLPTSIHQQITMQIPHPAQNFGEFALGESECFLKEDRGNSCMRLMGPIFQVRSRGRSSNICRNTHARRPETTPAPKPLRCTMKTRSWRLRVRPAPATMSVVINLLAEHCNINKTCRKFAALLLRFLIMTFWHTDRSVRGFSRGLSWSWSWNT